MGLLVGELVLRAPIRGNYLETERQNRAQRCAEVHGQKNKQILSLIGS